MASQKCSRYRSDGIAFAVNVEGSEEISDDELDNAQEDESPEASSILSPASKRAKKRQAAARNKRAKQEAKLQAEQQQAKPSEKSAPALHVKPFASNGTLKAASSASSSTSDLQQSAVKSNGASSKEKGLAPPPTFVNDNTSINGRLAADSAVPAGSRLGDPFLQQAASSRASTSAAAAPPPASSSSTTAATSYAASAATETEEEEDTSLLLDGDDESSSSSEAEEEGDISREEDERAEPPTPRPAPPKVFVNTVSEAADVIKSGTSTALNAVSQSSIAPAPVQNLAASAKDSEVLKSDDTVAAAAQAYGSDHDPSKKWKSVITRTVWTLVMIIGFAGRFLSSCNCQFCMYTC